MSKTIDITDKLSFEGNPKLIVRDIEIEVNTDAPTVLKFMKLINDEESSESSTMLKTYELLFSKENREKIESLNLDFTSRNLCNSLPLTTCSLFSFTSIFINSFINVPPIFYSTNCFKFGLK